MKKGKENVMKLGITSFLNDFSSEMILPILPFFLTSLGASPVIIGLLGGLRDSLTSILKVFFGFYSDKFNRRKPFLYGGYLTSTFFKFLLALSPTALIAVLFASLERIGKGMRDAPRDAMIGEFMPKRTGAAFGLHRMFDTGGAILGSAAVALILMYLSLSFVQIIIAASVVALLSIIPLIFVPESLRARITPKKGFGATLSSLPKNILYFTLIAAIFTLANFSYMFFILRAWGAGGIIIPILLYVLFNIFYALFSYPLGKHADKIGKRKVLIGGYALFGLVSLAFSQYSSLQSLIILFILYGIANAAVNAVQRAYIADMSPEKIRATAMGAFQTAVGLAALPSSIIAGYLWEAYSPAAAFIFGGIVSLLAASLLILWKFDDFRSGQVPLHSVRSL